MAKIKAFNSYKDELKSQLDELYDAASAARELNSIRYRESYRYYLGIAPSPTRGDTNLDYVEPVVYEAVEQLTPTILNIFTENETQAVRYSMPSYLRVSPVHAALEEAVNGEINKQFLRENKGYAVLENTIKECLITGNGFIKVFIEELIDDDKLELSDYISMEELVLSAGPDFTFDVPSAIPTGKKEFKYKGLDCKVEKANGQSILLIKGKLSVSKKTKELKVEQVDYKDVFFDPNCGSDFDKCRYFCHRKVMTVGEALEAGYPEDLISASSTLNVLGDDPLSKVHAVVDRVNSFTADDDFEINSADPMSRRIEIFEHYVFSSLPSGKTALYEVVATNDDIISVVPVSRIPFVNMMFNVIPGSMWGRSMYDLAHQYQDELSSFARIMKQRAAFSAFGVFSAVKNGYDRKSLIGLRPGSIVEVQEQGAVQPLVMPDVPQSVDAYLSRMRDSADRLVMAASNNIITQDGAPQLAASAIAMMINQSQMKDKTAAKTIARTAIEPLYKMMFDTMHEEDYTLDVDGQKFPVKQLPKSSEFKTDVNTVNDAAVQVNGLNQVLSTILQAKQAAGGIVSEDNLYQIAKFQCKSFGLDVETFFTDTASQNSDPAIQHEQMIANAAAKEAQMLQLDGLRSDNAIKAAQIALANAQIKDYHLKTAAQMERDKELSVREFHKLDSDIKLNEMKMQVELAKLKIDGAAVASEIQSGERNITGVKVD